MLLEKLEKFQLALLGFLLAGGLIIGVKNITNVVPTAGITVTGSAYQVVKSDSGRLEFQITAKQPTKALAYTLVKKQVPEVIAFLKSKGFVSFPRAYRSDNATVISCASGTGIRTITGLDAKVLWRESGINMSSSAELESLACHSDANISFMTYRIETFFYLIKVIRRKYKQIRTIPCRKIMF